LPDDPGLFQKRALTEAVHELGHTCSLPHCENRRCVMFFSNTLQDTDRKHSTFCRQCQEKLGKSLLRHWRHAARRRK
jgi:archaemetzincin